jgi:diguanylate cyclase (GGDEF)-like protein/PAS domain S-box-containing protein
MWSWGNWMNLGAAVFRRIPVLGALLSVTASAHSLGLSAHKIPLKSSAASTMASVTDAASLLFPNLLRLPGNHRLMAAEVNAILLLIAVLAVLRVRRARALHQIDESRARRYRSDSVLGFKIALAAGGLTLIFEILKTALNSGLDLWASHVITILFSVLVAALVAFAVLRREQQLRLVISQDEQRYKLLFEKSLTGAYRIALDGEVLDCNVTLCQMFGFETREELIGQSISFAYANPEDRAQFIAKLQAEKNLPNFEQRLQRRDGTPVWALNSATLVPGKAGSSPEIKGTITDISDIRRAELEHRRLAAIVSCSDDAIVSCTLDGIIETWNIGSERIFGYSASEAIGSSLELIAPPGAASDYKLILDKVAQGHSIERIETVRVRKGGRPLNVSLSVSPIRNAAGEVVGAAAIVLDISERKLAEQRLRESEVQYRILFETNPIPMWVFDRRTLRFLAVNQSSITQYGFTEQEFLARTIADIRPEEDVTELTKHVEEHVRGLQTAEVWRHRKKNGEIIDVEIVCHDLDFHGADAMLVAVYDITARKHSEEALLFKNALLEAQSESTIDGILVVDDSDRIILANKQFALHFGIPDELLAQGDDREAREFVTAQVENPKVFVEKINYLNEHRDQRSRDEIAFKNGKIFERYSAPLIDSNGSHRGRIWYFRDITERKFAEAAIRRAEEKYRTIFEDSVLGIFQITPEGRPISVNRALAQLSGYRSTDEFMTEVKNIAEQLFVDPIQMIEVAKLAARDDVARGVEVEIHCRDDSRKWVRINQRAVRAANNHILHYEGTVEDITERKAAEERVQFLAYYDALTELPHRALLQDRLSTALADASRRKEMVALLFLDLDRFKFINDSFGHSFGDVVLKEIARRLKQCTRAQDTVARVGGDEFLIMLNRVHDAADAAVAAQHVMNAMSAEFQIQGRSLGMSCSIGISIFPDHGADGETLIKNADAAMYFAKEAGRNDVRFFTKEMNIQAAERLALESSLRLALDRNEFFLVYQPQMNLSTGSIIGFEALLRWRHPELGLIPPEKFIPIAENIGLILPIGEWVLRTACEQACQWWRQSPVPVPIAVNVSAIQFRQENFRTLVKNVLHETGLAPQYLELELTESLLLSNQDVMFAVLRDFRAMGVKLSIDDFGTGYSSLSYLKQFSVNKLKIDRSFIRNVATDPGDAAITIAIISMAKSLGLKVIAEGVEDEAQISFLRAHNCDEIQGFYFSKPITAAEVANRMQYPTCAA